MEQLPFIPNQLYNRRSDIHGKYGGSWQSGIATSANYPYIFIFTGKSGHQHGYQDGWDNSNVFSYTGEGQSGDMKFTRGNLALRDHLQNGKRVFLFESEKKGFVKFISEVEYFDFGYFETHDTEGNVRAGIKFFFKRKGTFVPITSYFNEPPSIVEEPLLDIQFKKPNETERKGLITSRIGQGIFRKRVVHRWEYKCAVTGFDKLDILIASHIVPWANATDNERLDIHNGILLSPAYDALFDRHLISFENTGKIILSNAIEMQAYNKIGITGEEKIQSLSQYNFDYLERHRTRFNGSN